MIARDYISAKRPLPGIIPLGRFRAWPPAPNARPGPAESSQSGGDYVACRRLLRNRFVIPWMRALHNLNEEAYGGTLFHHCRTWALEKTPGLFGDIFEADCTSSTQVSSTISCRSPLRRIYLLISSIAGLFIRAGRRNTTTNTAALSIIHNFFVLRFRIHCVARRFL